MTVRFFPRKTRGVRCPVTHGLRERALPFVSACGGKIHSRPKPIRQDNLTIAKEEFEVKDQTRGVPGRRIARISLIKGKRRVIKREEPKKGKMSKMRIIRP